MHEVLVNRLGGLSLPRKSVVRLTDRPDMTLDVYRGRKTTIQPTKIQVRVISMTIWTSFSFSLNTFPLHTHTHTHTHTHFSVNPIALRNAKIVHNFGLSECNRVKLHFITFRWNCVVKAVLMLYQQEIICFR